MPVAARAAQIGAHVSVAGGLSRALARADAVGAEAIQLFVANPRAWASPEADPLGDEAFRQACEQRRLPVFVHAPYLINFGSPDARTLTESARALAFSLRRSGAMGAHGVVVHAGWAVGASAEQALRQVREQLLPVLDSAWAQFSASALMPLALVEPTGGGVGALASDAPSLSRYLDALGRDERVAVCLDTCHMHAAGHDLGSREALHAGTLRAFTRAAGRGRLRLHPCQRQPRSGGLASRPTRANRPGRRWAGLVPRTVRGPPGSAASRSSSRPPSPTRRATSPLFKSLRDTARRTVLR